MSQTNELEIMERIALDLGALKNLLHHLLIPVQKTLMH